MSEDDKTVAKLVGGAAGAAGGVLIANELHKRQFLNQIADKKSPFHENYHNMVEFLSSRAEDTSSIEELIRKQSGKPVPYERSINRARDYVQKYETIMKDVAKLEGSEPYRQELAKFTKSLQYRQVLDSKNALDAICNEARDIHSIEFRHHKGKPVTDVIMDKPGLTSSRFDLESGKLHLAEELEKPVVYRLHGVGAGTLPTYPDGGVTKLQPQEIEILSNHDWFKQAEKTVAAAEEKFVASYRTMLKKAAPETWLKEKAGKAPIGMVVSAALLGAVVVGSIAGLVVGNGSHRRRALEEKANNQAQPGIPGL